MFNIKHSPINSAAYGNLPVLLQSDQDLKNFLEQTCGDLLSDKANNIVDMHRPTANTDLSAVPKE